MKLLRHNLLLLLPLPCLLSSCMVFFNGDTHKVHIATNIKTDTININNRARRLDAGEITIEPFRKKEPLTIQVPDGDSVRLIEIRSRNSFNYVYDAVVTGGLSTVINRKNPKRYYYQKNIYIEKKDSIIRIRRFAPQNRHFNLNLSLPYVNTIYKRTTEGYKHSSGFMGISIGAEYYYRENRYFSGQFGGAIDIFVPFPAAIHIEGLHEASSVVLMNLRHNHSFGNVELGYGIAWSSYYWNIHNNKDSTFIARNMTTKGFGLSFAAQYRITKNFRVGLLYQPTFINTVATDRSRYQHLISAEMTFKFPFRRGVR